MKKKNKENKGLKFSKKNKKIEEKNKKEEKLNKGANREQNIIEKKEIKLPTLELKTENEIALDLALKIYKKFDKLIKSIVLFGSAAKGESTIGSDIDIVIIVDDASIKWDPELTTWYREELGKIIESNPYSKSLHINTIKLTVWWKDLMRGDPLVLNILRNGEELVDLAGFFTPLKFLLINGDINSTPEAIYTCLQRAPKHLLRSKASFLGAVEGLYWTMVDSAHAALIAAKKSPPSPEHIPRDLKTTFVDTGKLNQKYLNWYQEMLTIYKDIMHGKTTSITGSQIDILKQRTEEFLDVMAKLVKDIIK